MLEAARRDFCITSMRLVFQDFALLDYLSVLNNILTTQQNGRRITARPMGTTHRAGRSQTECKSAANPGWPPKRQKMPWALLS